LLNVAQVLDLAWGPKTKWIFFSKILGYFTIRRCYGWKRKIPQNFLASKSAITVEKKFTAGKKFYIFFIKNYNLLIPRPQ
jgi:hypothetical protein